MRSLVFAVLLIAVSAMAQTVTLPYTQTTLMTKGGPIITLPITVTVTPKTITVYNTTTIYKPEWTTTITKIATFTVTNFVTLTQLVTKYVVSTVVSTVTTEIYNIITFTTTLITTVTNTVTYTQTVYSTIVSYLTSTSTAFKMITVTYTTTVEEYMGYKLAAAFAIGAVVIVGILVAIFGRRR